MPKMSLQQKLILPLIWLPTTLGAVMLTLILLLNNMAQRPDETNSSELATEAQVIAHTEAQVITHTEMQVAEQTEAPEVLAAVDFEVKEINENAVKIDAIFKKYNCKLTGYGEVFADAAEKYELPFWLVASVAFQESSCGRFVPYKNGEYTYNYYGWGVWGDKVTKFNSVEHGVEVVSKYMYDKFFSKGITEPCDIMRVYTPPSDGAWCNGVKFFGNQMINYTN